MRLYLRLILGLNFLLGLCLIWSIYGVLQSDVDVGALDELLGGSQRCSLEGVWEQDLTLLVCLLPQAHEVVIDHCRVAMICADHHERVHLFAIVCEQD